MCETSDQKNPNIPKNADKVLFAEDFVNYVLLQLNLPYLSSGIADYRSSIYNAFNQTVIVAVGFLFRRLETENLAEFENIHIRGHPLNRDAFMNYVTSIELEYLSKGFDAQKLLHFCVKTATMAVRFYCSGFEEGPALAAQRIENILADFDMSSGGWERVNFIAANYARIYIDVDDTLTAESESEYESASESSTDSGDYSEASDTVAAVPQDKSGVIENEDQQDFSATVSQDKSDDIETEDQQDFSACEIVHHSSDLDSSDEEYSVASFSNRRCAEETGVDDRSIHEDMQVELLGPHSEFKTPYASDEDDSNDSCSHRMILAHADLETSSDDETKYDDVQEQESETLSSVYSSDTDDECFEEVFEECVDATPPSDQFGRQSARKRPASSSSSTNGFHLPGSADECSSCLTLPSTSFDNINLNSQNSAGASNVKSSPPRKHAAKTRRRC